MVSDDLERLKRIAERANDEGAWCWEQCGEKCDAPVVGIAHRSDDPEYKNVTGRLRDCDDDGNFIEYERTIIAEINESLRWPSAYAEHIATFDPPTVLGLLARLARAEGPAGEGGCNPPGLAPPQAHDALQSANPELREAMERLSRDLELQDGGGVAYTCQDAVYTVVVQGEDLRLLLAGGDLSARGRCPPTPDHVTGPVRVQLSRAKGWRMPPNTVKVDRSTKWGNPFVVGETYPIVEEGCHEPVGEWTITDVRDAVEAFRPWCEETMAQWGDLEPLRGKNLACWCGLGEPCHADVLLELANAPTGEGGQSPRAPDVDCRDEMNQ